MGFSVQSGNDQTFICPSNQFLSIYAKKLETLSFLKMEMLQWLIDLSVQIFHLLVPEVFLRFDWSQAVGHASRAQRWGC